MKAVSESSLLVVMAKEPTPGMVKTRLQPQLSPQEAADLYRCLLQDRLEASGTLRGADVAIAYAPETAGEIFSSLAPAHFRIYPQRGSDLGERLAHIFALHLTEGYRAVSIVDSDSPDLPLARISESFAPLLSGEAEVVFGPCEDGGYYLIGMKRIVPGFFRNIPWSTPRVLATSLERASSLGLKSVLLPSWQDVDTFQDLQALYRRMKKKAQGASGPGGGTLGYLLELERAGKLRLEE